MKEFKDIKFASWFENKLMKEAWNVSAMASTGFPYEVERETEKAVLIKITNKRKLLSSWTIWCPKSAILNLETL